ncbi:MAG: hypothetical protein P4L40_20335 [Terracidiphilus sp.]|nr:hypothetical protein [Terracidiphilus sp.]
MTSTDASDETSTQKSASSLVQCHAKASSKAATTEKRKTDDEGNSSTTTNMPAIADASLVSTNGVVAQPSLAIDKAVLAHGDVGQQRAQATDATRQMRQKLDNPHDADGSVDSLAAVNEPIASTLESAAAETSSVATEGRSSTGTEHVQQFAALSGTKDMAGSATNIEASGIENSSKLAAAAQDDVGTAKARAEDDRAVGKPDTILTIDSEAVRQSLTSSDKSVEASNSPTGQSKAGSRNQERGSERLKITEATGASSTQSLQSNLSPLSFQESVVSADSAARSLKEASSVSGEARGTDATFMALDSGRGIPAAKWSATGAHSVEAGYQDSSLGWVSVRALSAADGLHAAVVSGSSDAAQSLSIHLPELTTYLTANHTPVASLTVDACGANNAGESNQSGNAQAGSQQGRDSSGDRVGATSAAISSSRVSVSSGIDASMGTSLTGGTYISVLV